MRKILFIIPTYASFKSFLTELSSTLIDQGIDIHVICSQFSFNCDENNLLEKRISIHHVNFPRGANVILHLKVAREIRTIIKSIKPDLIHAHMTSAIFTTALSKTSYFPPTIATYQGLYSPNCRGVIKYIYKCAELFSIFKLTNTWLLTQDDYNYIPILKNKISIQSSFGFGVNFDKNNSTNYSQTTKTKIKKCYSINETSFNFIYIGRFLDFKGFALVVKSFLSFHLKHNDCRLLLVGKKDPLHPTGLTPTEENNIETHESIVHVGWCEQVADLLAISDVMLFPSQREGMPVCLMEAQRMGVPAITYNSRGCRDVVTENETGLFIQNLSIESLIDKMESIYNDRSRLDYMKKKSIELSDRFNRLYYIKEQISIYENILKI